MMKALSKSLKKHLLKETKNGKSTAILFAQSSLFATSLFLRKTTFYSKHDAEGVKTALLYQILALLLSYSNILRKITILRRTCGFKVTTLADFTCFMIAFLLEKIYEKSIGSLGVALSTAVLVLALLVIIRPSTDLGILGAIIGAAGSVTYSLYRFAFRAWVVAAICFALMGFKCWLHKNWLESEAEHDEPPLPTSIITRRRKRRILKSEIVESLMVTCFYLSWDYCLFKNKGRHQVKGLLVCLVILGLWIVSRFHALPRLIHRNERTVTETVPLITPVQQLPSALEMFEDITAAAPKVTGKRIFILLDYDGILSTVASGPNRASMSEMIRREVRSLAKFFHTAIVSNRSRDEVNDFLQLPELYNNDLNIKTPLKNEYGEYVDLFLHDSRLVPMIDEAFKQLFVKTKSIPRAKVEKNSNFCLLVHYGSVDEKNWIELVQHVDSVLQEYPELKLTHGWKVLEIRPAIEPDKGKVLASLLKKFTSGTSRFCLYIGDDHSDEDAFKILRDGGHGIGILVSQIPKHTNASYALRDQYEVVQFLHRLVDWRVKHTDYSFPMKTYGKIIKNSHSAETS